MRRLLKGVHTLMGGHAASKNVTLQLAVDNNVPDFLIGDPTRLRQVLLNLVNNAIKFTSQGNVVLQVKNLSEGDMNPSKPKQIYFAVQDSGIGISAEAQKKIFTPFSQADSSINRKFGGTGLGLTICKRLIEAMGSSIGINSREGEGSTFFFTLSLPVAGAQDISIRVPVAHDDKGRKLKVLVVDDNGINQKVLTGLLGKNGHHASLASNADEAVVKATSQQFDLILMDIELPGKSGIHATQEIRAYSKKEIAHTPIVAMTGNVSSEDRRQYLNVGMNDMLGKPVMPDSLQKVLNKTMSGEYETRSAPAQPSYVPPRPSPFAAQPISQTPPEAIAPQPVQNAVHAPISADEYIPSPPVPLEEFIHQTSAGKDAKPGTVPSSEVTSSDWQNVDMDDEEDSFSSAVRAIEQEENDRQLSTDTKISDNGTLDENLIASLIKSLGAGQTKDLLKDFYEKTEELIMQINEAFKAQDPVNIKARAHELKGMAANFGFKSLGQTAGIIEKDVMNAKHAELVGMIESLQGLYTQSRAEMDARLA
jgi:CheY-like chemotaxis protein/HPt (histidine-containing phosphotransfer) domain-containing protein